MEEELLSSTLPSYILVKPTPSLNDGIDSVTEKIHRIYGCELIQEVGILLRLPQVVMATGQSILHRFYYRKSLKRFDVFTVAMGCILLATKVEETSKTLREVLFVFHHVYLRRKKLKLVPLELGGIQYSMWKNELITIERYILKELGFSIYNIMDHPHKYILYFVKLLNGSNELAQVSWNYLNDSLRLDLNLRYNAEVIACAAIFLAIRKLQLPIPEYPPWWEVMNADLESIMIICEGILSLYRMEKLFWLEPIASVDYLSAENCAKFDPPPSNGNDFMKTEEREEQIVTEDTDQQDESRTTGDGNNGHGDPSEVPTRRVVVSYKGVERALIRSSSKDRGGTSSRSVKGSDRDRDGRRGDRRDSRDRDRDNRRDRDRDRGGRDRDRIRDDSRDRDRDRDRDRRKRSNSRDKDRDRRRDRSRDRDRDRDRDRSRDRDRDRRRDSSRDKGRR